jgi:negative regulator of sigma E activity
MMNCEQAKELLSLYAAGELDGAKAAELESHLNICAECSDGLKEAKALFALTHDALLHFEPGEDFEKKVAARIAAESIVQPSRSAVKAIARRWYLYPMAAAAAVLIVALVLLQNKPAGMVLAGKVSGEGTTIKSGQTYVAKQPSAIELINGAKAFLVKEAAFSVISDALHLLTGSCYVDCRASSRQATRLATSGLFVELRQAEAYMRAGVLIQETAPHAGLLDVIMPPVYAQDTAAGAAALVVVFSGTAEAVAGGSRFMLGGGEFLFEDETGAGPRMYEAFLKDAGSRIEGIEREAKEIEKHLEPYTHVITDYKASLAGLKEIIDRLGAEGGAEIEELKVRVALIEEVKAAHEARAGQMLAELNKTRSGAIEDLKARVQALMEAEQTRRDALDNLGRL